MTTLPLLAITVLASVCMTNATCTVNSATNVLDLALTAYASNAVKTTGLLRSHLKEQVIPRALKTEQWQEATSYNITNAMLFIREAEKIARERITLLETFNPSNVISFAWGNSDNDLKHSLDKSGMTTNDEISDMNQIRDLLLLDYCTFVTNDVPTFLGEISFFRRIHDLIPTASRSRTIEISRALAKLAYKTFQHVAIDSRPITFCSTKQWFPGAPFRKTQHFVGYAPYGGISLYFRALSKKDYLRADHRQSESIKLTPMPLRLSGDTLIGHQWWDELEDARDISEGRCPRSKSFMIRTLPGGRRLPLR